MVGMYKDPQGETIFSMHTSGTQSEHYPTQTKNTTDDVEVLKNKVIQLETLLSEQVKTIVNGVGRILHN